MGTCRRIRFRYNLASCIEHNGCEIALRPHQMCNLTEVNVSTITSQEDFHERVRAAAFIGTLQAGYTDFHYLRQVWRDATKEDALLGVGLTGIASGNIEGYDESIAADLAICENVVTAKLIGINPAARVTTVKPAGTTSLVLGCSSGIHAWHSEYYIRRMRVGKNEALYSYIKEKLPKLVEDDKFNPAGAVLSFPQRAPEGARTREETVVEFLERVSRYNRNWVAAGHVSGANRNNVSCTVSIKEGEWEIVGEWMWRHRGDYNGISVLPYDGGTYVQAPFEECSEETFYEILECLEDVDLTEVRETSDNTDLKGEVACSGGVCDLVM
jgi:ribonucleoside-triphosphate reductase (thioredoxin)